MNAQLDVILINIAFSNSIETIGGSKLFKEATGEQQKHIPAIIGHQTQCIENMCVGVRISLFFQRRTDNLANGNIYTFMKNTLQRWRR